MPPAQQNPVATEIPKGLPRHAARGTEPGRHRGVGAATDGFTVAVTGLFLDTANLLGVPKSVAVIYAVLFASAAPLTFAEVEGRSGVSKGSVSQGLRFLREIGAVRIADGAEEAGLDHARSLTTYEPVVELRTLLSRLIADKIQPQVESGGERIAALKRSLPELSAADAKVLSSRIKHLEVWHRRSRDFLPLLKTFLAVSNLRKK